MKELLTEFAGYLVDYVNHDVEEHGFTLEEALEPENLNLVIDAFISVSYPNEQTAY